MSSIEEKLIQTYILNSEIKQILLECIHYLLQDNIFLYIHHSYDEYNQECLLIHVIEMIYKKELVMIINTSIRLFINNNPIIWNPQQKLYNCIKDILHIIPKEIKNAMKELELSTISLEDFIQICQKNEYQQ